MNWRDAEALLAAKNATVVRAALSQSIDPVAIWRGYQETHPVKTDNITQDRARARAWAMLSVNFDNAALEAALRKLWAEGWATGWAAAPEMIEARKDLTETAIDWDRWRPGDAAAAALVRPPGALKAILDSVGIEIKNMTRTGYDLIGTQLADAVSAGLSERRAAKLIRGAVASPARALRIAVTEQNRAVSAATVTRYRDAGLDRMEWATSDPCPICAANSGQVVAIGSSFNSGHTQPPAHPWCRCTLMPVLDEGEPDHTAGAVTIIEPQPAAPLPTERKSEYESLAAALFEKQSSIPHATGYREAFENYTKPFIESLKGAPRVVANALKAYSKMGMSGGVARLAKNEKVMEFLREYSIQPGIPLWRGLELTKDEFDQMVGTLKAGEKITTPTDLFSFSSEKSVADHFADPEKKEWWRAVIKLENGEGMPMRVLSLWHDEYEWLVSKPLEITGVEAIDRELRITARMAS